MSETFQMAIEDILTIIDKEIERLELARKLLAVASSSGSKSTERNTQAGTTKKRTMSAEGRAKIVAAQKARWAAAKKSQ